MSISAFNSRVVLLLALHLHILAALGKLYVTSPVDGTSWTAGQNQTVSWKDDGIQPSLTQFGKSSVGIYIGSSTVQTVVQQIVASVDVATTESIVFTPDPSVGASGDYYFIRFQSLDLKDANNSAYPAEAFSATFTITGMTGSFNATEQSDIGTMAAGASATNPATQSASESAATTPFRFASATTSHTLGVTPTSTADALANGVTSRLAGSVSGWGASALTAMLLAVWVV
ncbi:hypothetical protein DAEQUDRAFT_732656 [Daedalea quercina L-15889]|uniref:Yeast cell wall synthesis Kre9/Knh1-like N-terminal domain-containing protein n=1 Tax=Daedalea quercina L-15889 TaxID=1314783 RepID=A0A165LHH3_9APHY|nr:hypothetical protein DAEQUDRAFT_732656 [Daedalea quercina L-15889]